MLAVIKHNNNRQIFDIQAFEVGTLHFKEGDVYSEKRGLAIILSGRISPYHYEEKPRNIDFFDLKGHVENLFSSLGIFGHFKKAHFKTLHPGRQAEILVGSEIVGVMGEVHPNECAKVDLDPRSRVYFAQIDLQKLALFELNNASFVKLPEYPSSERDLTITLNEEISLESILNKIKAIECPVLAKVELIDIFKDPTKVGVGKQNVSLRFTYREDHKTIEMKDVEEAHNKISKSFD